MPNPVWPPSLPQFFLLGFSDSVAPNWIESSVDAGISKRRKQYTARKRMIGPITMYLTPAQRVTLDEFFDDTGVGRFDYADPIDNVTVKQLRFAGGITYSLPEPGRYQASMQFEVLP